MRARKGKTNYTKDFPHIYVHTKTQVLHKSTTERKYKKKLQKENTKKEEERESE